jgi:hypothetical protein
MKISKSIVTFLLMVVLGWVQITIAKSFETSLLKDEKGLMDLKTKAVVHYVSNMNGSVESGKPTVWRERYVGIQIPILGIDPKKIVVLDSDGKFIKHKYPEALEGEIDQKGTRGTYIKLFLEHPPGFSFRLRYDD